MARVGCDHLWPRPSRFGLGLTVIPVGGIDWYAGNVSDGARRGSSASSALSVLRTVLIALGVVLMHTTLPVPAAAAHDAMPAPGQPNSVIAHHSADTPTVDIEAVAHVPCPSGYDMVHPCIGTVTSFPAMSVPTGTAELMPVLDNASSRAAAIVARAGRAPPWAVYSLDKSVSLRV